MTSPTPVALINTVAPLIGDLGSKFMLDAATMARANELGYEHPFAFYFIGRGGVLGDVDADVVTSAFAFFEPNMVRLMWDMAHKTSDSSTAVGHYAEVCAEYGRQHISGAPNLQRFNELAERVTDAVDPAGLSLFAGWRRVPRPDDVPARAYHNLHVLREWRGSAHVCAVAAASLNPHIAILTSKEDIEAAVQIAKMFGWSTPPGDVSTYRQIRDEVEQVTTRMQVDAYNALSDAERLEFAELVQAISAAHI